MMIGGSRDFLTSTESNEESKAMKQYTVSAEVRKEFGKNAARRLRRAGMIPAVVYGNAQQVIPLTVDPKQLGAIFHSGAGHNTIFALDIQNQPPVSVMIKEWINDPIKGNLLHADLVRVALDKTLQVEVAISAIGEPKGVKVQGGIFEFVLREVEIECLPADIPENITIDISELEIGANLRVSDLPVGPKIKVLSDPDLVVAHVISPKAEKVPEPGVEPTVAEPEVIKKGKVAEEGEVPEAKVEDKEKKEKK
jgi:large subunit ribosomal protein L25